MQIVFLAILPILLLLVLGNIARRSDFLTTEFWLHAEKGTYFVLFPCLLILRLSQANIDFYIANKLILLAFLTPIIATGLIFLLQYFRPREGADFTSLFQGGTRFNSFIGLSLVFSLLPESAGALAAIVLAVMIPWINVLCIIVFARYAQGSVSMPSILRNISRNPLIIACLLGLFLNITGLSLPLSLRDVMQQLGAMTLPLGLMCVGAGLQLKALRRAGWSLWWTAWIKLLLLPIIVYGLGLSMALLPEHLGVMVLFAGLPTATSSYILARQLGGNAELMAVLITGQTLIALGTLPLLLHIVLNY